MLRLILLKIRHQPLLLGIFIFTFIYGTYFAFKMVNQDNSMYWFKICNVYLNCLVPALVSMIVAIQSKFEDDRHDFNHVLSLSSRTQWLLVFGLETYFLWLLNIILISVILLTLTHVALVDLLYLWISLAVLSMIWLPILVFGGVVYGYRLVVGIGIISIPFMIYYGTEEPGKYIWMFIPWLYNTKIYLLIGQLHLVYALCVIVLITVIEQVGVNYYFNRWTT